MVLAVNAPVVLKPIHILTHILARVDINLLLAVLTKLRLELLAKHVLAGQLPVLAINAKIRPIPTLTLARADINLLLAVLTKLKLELRAKYVLVGQLPVLAINVKQRLIPTLTLVRADTSLLLAALIKRKQGQHLKFVLVAQLQELATNAKQKLVLLKRNVLLTYPVNIYLNIGFIDINIVTDAVAF